MANSPGTCWVKHAVLVDAKGTTCVVEFAPHQLGLKLVHALSHSLSCCNVRRMLVLRHGRDVHPTWASVDNMTVTLRVWDSKSTKSDKDLGSF